METIIDNPQYKHPAFLVHSRGRKPRPETLYFALLIRAKEQGTLAQEAQMLRVTLELAEAQVRRFGLLPVKRQEKVRKVIRRCDSELDQVRKIASDYRFSVVGIER